MATSTSLSCFDAGARIVGEAASGAEGVALADELSPDLVLMDVRMPGMMDGINAARRLTASHKETMLVLISVEDLADVTDTTQPCGATAFVRKQDFGPRLCADGGPTAPGTDQRTSRMASQWSLSLSSPWSEWPVTA